jgi:3',5'-cyclic AMP phosphodiesterase CpdA
MMKRSGFIAHVGWTGAGIAFALGGAGVVRPISLADAAQGAGSPYFVQISDSHIGFAKAANENVTGTLQKTIEAINALPQQPAFVVHTGDVTHLSKPAEFDTARQLLGTLRAPLVTLPGEHDVIGDGGKAFLASFGRRDAPDGWFSFDEGGVHYVALVNVFNFETMGLLGRAQLEWLRRDLAPLAAGTRLVVFGHVPLYALYPAWGWTTEDGAQALAYLARFEGVTVLNGHIHQVIEHREGTMRFYTAASTAYPQPEPGKAEKPGPLVVPRDELLSHLGFRTVEVDAQARVVQHALG